MARAARQLKLAGVFAAAVTPNRPGTLEPDYTGSLDLLDFLAAGGVDGICMLGSTGEFLNFSFSDRQRLLYLSNKRTRVPLIAGVSHSTLSGALQLADDAISSGVDALLVMPPYFFRYTQPEIEEFYRVFARETGNTVPLLLYNIPQFTSPVDIGTASSLLSSGLYAGIKDSSGDWEYFSQLLALRKTGDFALLAGNDRIAARALAEGADGVVSGCACALPELLVSINKAVRGCDTRRIEDLHSRLLEFIDGIEKFPVPAGINKAVAARGQRSAEGAVPLSSEQHGEMLAFAGWLKSSADRLWGRDL